eukprot:CAMPEP_0195305950 /NCGR_PEP_ID=MMETSP0707-20130614/36953_1 /TAXON_ID=33640 /ORGANISM="Asterionellopsis glacialis, Strain CCMP134" /LENGTH=791 /DNA_ID=CAMNT_0040370159 /DNA_START=175 /DNA_END=2550 /DNA_ORIENTATION=-
MGAAQPCDEIVLAEGTTFYAEDLAAEKTHFVADVSGTATSRITIRSENPANRATLKGESTNIFYVLRILGDYWTVKDLIFTNAQKGIMLDHANNVEVLNCEVYNIGLEAIHVRDGSNNALIEDCFVHDTGVVKPQYGEGIYIGSDKKTWGDYDAFINGTIVRRCTIGPNIGAEAFDIKEGTSETIIEYNIVDATNISGANYADSFIDLKGTRTYVRYNKFYRNNATELEKGIGIVPRSVEKSTYEHVIHDNVFYLDDPAVIPMIKSSSKSGFRDIYAFNNLPSDGIISDGVNTECCSSWYTPPPNQTIVCLRPVGSFSSLVTNTTATLSWTAYASYFTVIYNKIGSSTEEEKTAYSSPLLLEDLEYNVTYEWKVKSNCATSSSQFTSTDVFTTGSPSDGPPPYADGSVVVYDDDLGSFWSDHSFSLTPNIAYTEDKKYGSQSIKCDYGDYGGLNLKRSVKINASNLTYVQFWAKGDSDVNGPGDVTLRLKVNGVQTNFQILNNVWANYRFALEDLNDPDEIESIVIQNNYGTRKLVYFDQIELVPEDATPSPTVLTSSPSQSPSNSQSPSEEASSHPSSKPSYLKISSTPTLSPSELSSSDPSSSPVSYPSSKPSYLKISSTPTLSPSELSSSDPSSSPVVVISDYPSAAPQADGCGSSCIEIYTDSLDSSWTAEYSWKCTYDLTHTSDALGTNSISVSLRSYGGLYLKSSPELNIGGLQSLQFWMKGENAGHKIRVKIDGKRHDVLTSGDWKLYDIPLSKFSNPTTIEKLQFQNGSSQSRHILIDNVRFL